MADTFTIAAAARLCHVDRRTLQRAIRRGTLHLDANHCLSREDLLLAGYLVADTPLAEPQSTPQHMPLATPLATPLLPLLVRLTTALEGIWHELQRLQSTVPVPQSLPWSPSRVMPLSEPQVAPQPTPQAAPQAAPLVPPHHRQPSRQRPAAPPPPGADTPELALGSTQGPQRRSGRPPGPLRLQILALLQAHPEGLRAEEIRVYVQTPRPIGDTLAGMVRGGVIRAEGDRAHRRYVATAPSPHDQP